MKKNPLMILVAAVLVILYIPFGVIIALAKQYS